MHHAAHYTGPVWAQVDALKGSIAEANTGTEAARDQGVASCERADRRVGMGRLGCKGSSINSLQPGVDDPRDPENHWLVEENHLPGGQTVKVYVS